jgi:hypothetical protein
MACSMIMLFWDASSDSRYSAVPHSYCLPQPSVSSHSVESILMTFYLKRYSNKTSICALVVDASCFDSSEKCEWDSIVIELL